MFWLLLAFSVAVEVGVARWVLRRMGVDMRGFAPALVLVQLITWAAVVGFSEYTFSSDDRYDHYHAANCVPLVATLLMVVVAEVLLLRVASRGWLLAPRCSSQLTMAQAIVASVAGNVAAVGALVAPFLLFAGAWFFADLIVASMP